MDNKSDRRKHHIIYKTTCLVTGRWYLGMHSTNDLDDGYLGSGTHLQRSLKKHGKENHRYEILETLPSRSELRIREQEILTEEFISDPLCMNIRFSCSAGNDPGFWMKSDRAETIKKISASSKRMWEELKTNPAKLAEINAKRNTSEIVEKRAEAIKAKNHKRTPEQKLNLAQGQAKYYAEADSAKLKERGQKSAVTRLLRGTNKGGRPKGIPATESQKQCKEWIVMKETGETMTIRNLLAFCAEHQISRTSFCRTKQLHRFMKGFMLMGHA